MLYDTDLTTFDIQDFCANTLKNDTEFSSFCATELDGTLNFETDAVLNDYDMLPAIPYCTIHAGNESQDFRSNEWGHTYEIVMVLGISDTSSASDKRPPSTIENEIVKYSSTRTIEKVVKKAIITLREKMAATGINGDYEIQIVSANGTKTATGEADDMNYILSLSFSYLETISKGC